MIHNYNKESIVDAYDLNQNPNIKGGEIRTYSGLYLDPFHPNVGAISLVDIAHALSNSCRYGGHCPRFYSVAEHSTFVADLCELDGITDKPVLLAALLHDAEEAYLTDIPSPIKRQMPEYRERGEALRETIFRALGARSELYATIKKYDEEAYVQERSFLWDPDYRPYTPEEAKERFLDRCVEYGLAI